MAEPFRSWLDFTSLERTNSPNDALASTPDISPQAASSRSPIYLPADPAAVGDALRNLEPTMEIRTEPSGALRARYVAVTPLLRLKDDVDLLICPSGERQSVVAVYSRSRIGYSDLGTNAKRIVKLERRLRIALAGNQTG